MKKFIAKMPYTQSEEKLVFIKLEPFKPVYGTWKESEGKQFIYIRKIDYSSLLTGNWEKIKSTFASSQDWYIPIKCKQDFNWNNKKLCVQINESERPWLSWIITPANQRYLMKARVSATGMTSYGAAAIGVLDPALLMAGLVAFSQKQQLKRFFSQTRQEKSPSLMPKVLTRKCWFIDTDEYHPYEYANHLLLNKLI